MPSDAERLLVRFRDTDTATGVSRDTLKRIARTLGTDETAAVHLALAKLKDEVLPRYERDDGPLTEAQLRRAKSLVSQDLEPTSSLFGPTRLPRGTPTRRARTKA